MLGHKRQRHGTNFPTSFIHLIIRVIKKQSSLLLQRKHRRNWMGDVEPMPETGSTMEMSILRTTILLRFVSACLTLPFLMEVSDVEAGDGRVPRE